MMWLKINQLVANGYLITAAIMQSDDAVLVNNRLTHKIPIVDEVSYIDKVPVNMLAAVEVAETGRGFLNYLILMGLRRF